MTVGLAFFYGGLEPRRNVLHMLMMNFFWIAIVTVVWALLGFTLAFGPDVGGGFIGNFHYAALMHMGGIWPGTHIPKLVFMLFQLMFAIITPALVSGALRRSAQVPSLDCVLRWLEPHRVPGDSPLALRPGGLALRDGCQGLRWWSSRARERRGVRARDGAPCRPAGKESRRGLQASLCASRPPRRRDPLVRLVRVQRGSALGANQLAANAFTATQLAAAAASITWVIMEHAFTGRMTVVGLATGGVVGCTGADIDIRTNLRISQIGQMFCLGSFANSAFLNFDKIAQNNLLANCRMFSNMREGPYLR